MAGKPCQYLSGKNPVPMAKILVYDEPKLSTLHVDKLLIKLLLSRMKQPSVHTLGACQ